MNKQVCIIGLGHVGLSLAAKIASMNFKVFGIDSDSKVISCIKDGNSPFFETDLLDLLQSPTVKAKLKLTESWAEISASDVIIIAVGTPINTNGESILTFLDDCTSSLGETLRSDQPVIYVA